MRFVWAEFGRLSSCIVAFTTSWRSPAAALSMVFTAPTTTPGGMAVSGLEGCNDRNIEWMTIWELFLRRRSNVTRWIRNHWRNFVPTFRLFYPKSSTVAGRPLPTAGAAMSGCTPLIRTSNGLVQKATDTIALPCGDPDAGHAAQQPQPPPSVAGSVGAGVLPDKSLHHCLTRRGYTFCAPG